MYAILTGLPAILALLLWLDWFRQGGRIVGKILVLLVILGAASLQFFFDRPLLGLLLQVPVALGLLLWKRFDSARGW
jgi:hypothetical protein